MDGFGVNQACADSGYGVYQDLARELVCPKSLLVVERPGKATRPKSVWLFQWKTSRSSGLDIM